MPPTQPTNTSFQRRSASTANMHTRSLSWFDNEVSFGPILSNSALIVNHNYHHQLAPKKNPHEHDGFGLVQMYDLISKLEVPNVHILDAVVLGKFSSPKGLYSSGLDYQSADGGAAAAAAQYHSTIPNTVNYNHNWPTEEQEEQNVKRLFLIKRETTDAARGRLLLKHMSSGLSSSFESLPLEPTTNQQQQVVQGNLSSSQPPKDELDLSLSMSRPRMEEFPAALHLQEIQIPQKSTEAIDSQAAEIAVKVTPYNVRTLEGAVSRKELKEGILLKYPRFPPAHHNLIRVIFTPYITKVEYHQNDKFVVDHHVPLKDRITTNIRSQGVSIIKPSAEVLASADALCDAIFETFRENGVLVRMGVYYCMHIGNGRLVLMWVGKLEVRPLDGMTPQDGDVVSSPASTTSPRNMSKKPSTNRLIKYNVVESSSADLRGGDNDQDEGSGGGSASTMRPPTHHTMSPSASMRHGDSTRKETPPRDRRGLPQGSSSRQQRGATPPSTSQNTSAAHPVEPTTAPPPSPIKGPVAVDQNINLLHNITDFGFYTHLANYEVHPIGIRAQIKGYAIVQDNRLNYSGDDATGNNYPSSFLKEDSEDGVPSDAPPQEPLSSADREILEICRVHNRWVEAAEKDPALLLDRPFKPPVEEPPPEPTQSVTPRSDVPEDPDFPDLERNAAAWQIHSKETVSIRQKYGSNLLEKEEKSYAKTVKARRADLVLRPTSRSSNKNNNIAGRTHGGRAKNNNTIKNMSSIHRQRSNSTMNSTTGLACPTYHQPKPWYSVSHRDYSSSTAFHPNGSKQGTVELSAVERLIKDQNWKAGVTRRNVSPVKDGSLMNYLSGCSHMTKRPPPPMKLVDPRDITGAALERRHQLFLGRTSILNDDKVRAYTDGVADGGEQDYGGNLNGSASFVSPTSLSPQSTSPKRRLGGGGNNETLHLTAALPPAPVVEFASTHQSLSEQMLRANRRKGIKKGKKGSGTVLEQLFGPLGGINQRDTNQRRSVGSSLFVYEDFDPAMSSSFGASVITREQSTVRLRPIINNRHGVEPSSMLGVNNDNINNPPTKRISFLQAGITTSPSRLRNRVTTAALPLQREESMVDNAATNAFLSSTNTPSLSSAAAAASSTPADHNDQFGATGIKRYAHHLVDTIDDLVYRAQCGQGDTTSSGTNKGGDRTACIRVVIPSSISDYEERRDLYTLMVAAGFTPDSNHQPSNNVDHQDSDVHRQYDGSSRRRGSEDTNSNLSPRPKNAASPPPPSNNNNKVVSGGLMDEEEDEDYFFEDDRVLLLASSSVHLTRARECLKVFCNDVDALFRKPSTKQPSSSSATSSSPSSVNTKLGLVKKLVITQGYSFVDAILSCHPAPMNRSAQ